MALTLPRTLFRVFAPALLALAAASGAPAAVAQGNELELKLKAAFLYNFAKFVNWPESRFAGPQSPLELCVLEPDPLGEVLEVAVRGKQIGSHPLTVRRTGRGESVRSCHVMFVGGADAALATGVFGRLDGAGIMTVHESAQAVPGGVARLYVDNRKMRFEINTTAVERENLQISSKLLSVASRVER